MKHPTFRYVWKIRKTKPHTTLYIAIIGLLYNKSIYFTIFFSFEYWVIPLRWPAPELLRGLAPWFVVRDWSNEQRNLSNLPIPSSRSITVV